MLLRCQSGTIKMMAEFCNVKVISDLARVISLQRGKEVQLLMRGESTGDNMDTETTDNFFKKFCYGRFLLLFFNE